MLLYHFARATQRFHGSIEHSNFITFVFFSIRRVCQPVTAITSEAWLHGVPLEEPSLSTTVKVTDLFFSDLSLSIS